MPYIDVTDATFDTEVVQRSHDVPVVIDLWAPWCGPCRSLGPIIERVVDGTGGQVVLVKVNVDENPRISQAFQVQSIPAVFAVKDRKVVDSFIGALPEHQVKQWVEGLVPSKSPAEIALDEAIDEQDETKLEAVLEGDPGNARAITALAELRVGAGRNDEALALLAKIPETPETVRVAALARLGAPADDSGEVVAELEGLLDQVKANDEARQRYVDLLAVLDDDPRVPELRRKLAARLY
jgi:putative thioredoxin